MCTANSIAFLHHNLPEGIKAGLEELGFLPTRKEERDEERHVLIKDIFSDLSSQTLKKVLCVV